ncbi:hypothetical protein PHYPSEUDO_006309 [Phytophthora pseudosyringae]|uniref:Uncharacterized protein n=1 Tax=Phytophthora pseudosyringae TaxID=221518 RepID=A0A8T1VP84_9STRA|nr:hypothetical protein PHYPSEUDO_006309 [Phytophthora pseudosyringae]
MASRNAPALSSLLYVRDKASGPKRTANAAPVSGTTGVRDPFETKVMCTMNDVFQVKQAGQEMSIELVTKEEKDAFWRQFAISKAAVPTNHR